MAITFFTLGTSGLMPTERRETCCHAMLLDDMLLIFGFGSGARRLRHPEFAPKIKDARQFFIFLSGYSLDLTIGLAWLPYIFEGKQVTIAGPEKAIAGASLRETLKRFEEPPFRPAGLPKKPADVRLVDLHPGTTVFKNFGVEAAQVADGIPSMILRIDDLLAYSVGAPCTEKTLELAEGAAMLLHGCWLDEKDCAAAMAEGGDPSILKTNAPVTSLTETAAAAGVELLALTCLNPAYREGRLRRMEQDARRRFPYSLLLHDFQDFPLEG